MSCTPCACQRSQLSIQAFCAQPNLHGRGVSRCHVVKSAYLGRRISSYRLSKRQTLRRDLNNGCQFKRKTTVSAVFGVGAPEAIVVGVVALVVFGPKGLADAAKSLGKSLKGFAPTIRELAGVSKDLKQTLEQEIGLDEIRREWRDGSSSYPPYRDDSSYQGNRLDTAAKATQSTPTTPELKEASDEIAKEVDPGIEAKRAEAARLAWGNTSSTSNSSESAHESKQASNTPKADAAAAPQKSGASFDGMTIEQLEAELAKRRAKAPSQSSSQ